MSSQAAAVLLVETVCKSGLDAAISTALEPWRKPRAVHDPGKILLDVELAVVLGGDCLADVALEAVDFLCPRSHRAHEILRVGAQAM